MARNVYEGMFLLDSGKTAGTWDNVTKLVHGILERHKAEVIASRPWDERRLAFSVSGHKKGMYLLTYFRVEGPSLTEIDHDCRINETILRQLVTKVPPKLVDQLVAQAMAPHEPPPPPAGADREVEEPEGVDALADI
ncbi:MAG: 30S ribosomal protein S6 [Planctomycetes bacterium]|nr:30S ribosomal protein S6 [Planctomycetota bacterium]